MIVAVDAGKMRDADDSDGVPRRVTLSGSRSRSITSVR
jgi:hypothetical protein